MSGARAHIAFVDASDETHAALRGAYAARSGAAYACADDRVYGFMRVADAMRFYGAINARWDREQLIADLESAGLTAKLEVRRMRTAFQRALVVALIAATRPDALVVERADQFDAEAAAALLARIVRRVPHAVVTYAPGAAVPPGLYDELLPPAEASALS